MLRKHTSKTTGRWRKTPASCGVPAINGTRVYGFHLTPKISFAQRLSGSLRVRASYGAGYRAPSLKELHFVFDHSNLGYKVLGSPSLKPERTWGLNVGAEFEPLEALDLRVNYFHNRLRNLIQTVFDPTQSSGSVAIYAYDNVGRAVTRGIEFGLSAQLGDWLAINGGYTYLRARDQDAQRDLPGRPRHVSARSSEDGRRLGRRAV